jgi:hypothetical protein
MAKRLALHLEHAVCREEAQDAAERFGVGADGRREVGASSGGCLLVQRVGDAEAGDHVKASMQTIPARNLLQCSERIRLNHGTLLRIVFT